MHVSALSPRGAVASGQEGPRLPDPPWPFRRPPEPRAPADTVTLGPGPDPAAPAGSGGGADDQARASGADRPGADPPLIGSGAAEGLTQEQRALLEQLRTRDREVRAHEAAHQAAGGGLAGGATFSYQTGPDGRSYAVGGEVPIDLSAGRTPEETISRARQIRAAALAPADPSGQDLRVAGEAAALEMRALLELLQARQAPGQPTLLPDHLHAGAPCLACEKNAASYAAPAAGAAEPP